MPRDRRRARQRRVQREHAGVGLQPPGTPVGPADAESPHELDDEALAAVPVYEDERDELEDHDEDEAVRSLTPARRPRSRVATFLRGSWLELHRVQWPDRRQVTQATAVVLGFVIIAGTYLGLMDALFQRVVNFILK